MNTSSDSAGPSWSGPGLAFRSPFSVPCHLWHLPRMCGGAVSVCAASSAWDALSFPLTWRLLHTPGLPLSVAALMPCPSPLTWRLLHTLGLPLSVAARELLPSLETEHPGRPPSGRERHPCLNRSACPVPGPVDVCWVNDWWYRFVEMHTERSDPKLACNATREPEMGKERSLL